MLPSIFPLENFDFGHFGLQTQLERHENVILRQDNDKLRLENELLKQNMSDPICNNCGGPVVPGPVSDEQQQLRIENARLTDELGRVCALANKFLGRPLTSSANPIPPFSTNSKLDLAVGINGYGNLGHTDNMLPMGLDNNRGIMMPLMKPIGNAVGKEVPHDRSIFVDLALAAMDELIKMAQIESPIWIKSLDGGKEVLNHEEYTRTFPRIGMKPSNFVTEATRESGVVLVNISALVETLMDVVCYLTLCAVMNFSIIFLLSMSSLLGFDFCISFFLVYFCVKDNITINFEALCQD